MLICANPLPFTAGKFNSFANGLGRPSTTGLQADGPKRQAGDPEQLQEEEESRGEFPHTIFPSISSQHPVKHFDTSGRRQTRAAWRRCLLLFSDISAHFTSRRLGKQTFVHRGGKTGSARVSDKIRPTKVLMVFYIGESGSTSSLSDVVVVGWIPASSSIFQRDLYLGPENPSNLLNYHRHMGNISKTPTYDPNCLSRRTKGGGSSS